MITETVNVFGWIIHHCKATVGETINFVSKRETKLSRLSAQTIYTKGLITTVYTDSGVKGLDRVPGFCTLDLPDPLPALDIKATVQEDSEWWCISLPTNKEIPPFNFLKLKKGESRLFSNSELIFICSGSIETTKGTLVGPVSVTLSNTETITAQEDTYGFIFDKRNENI
jgi:hypothetical protein